jgi:hypothetical protein
MTWVIWRQYRIQAAIAAAALAVFAAVLVPNRYWVPGLARRVGMAPDARPDDPREKA